MANNPTNGFYSSSSPPLLTLLLLVLVLVLLISQPTTPSSSPSDHVQPLDPSDFPPFTTVPAFPVIQTSNLTCHLDLSDELFGGVSEACSGPLDRSRCCPVLASWLFAAHARSALYLPPHYLDLNHDDGITPMMPDDSQRCVDALQSSLQNRSISLARPNATCDAVICFCGIRLHHLSTLRCPAAFDVNATSSSNSTADGGKKGAVVGRLAAPTPALRELERSCTNASYAGCTRCLRSLRKLKGENATNSSFSGVGDRASKMFGRDCQLMGLTWLLQLNKTAYIPTVSAVLRALLYSAHPLGVGDVGHNHKGPRCSPDQENMPLAVNSLEFKKLGSSVASRVRRTGAVAVAVMVMVWFDAGNWVWW